MNKTILVAPFDGPYAASLVNEARAAGWRVVLAVPETGAAKPSAEAAPGRPAGPQEDSDLVTVAWNPASYVSTSALFLAARNAFGAGSAGESGFAGVDAAVLFSGAHGLRADLVGGKPGEIEACLQRETLGPAHLVRETLRVFEARKAGSIVFVCPEPEAGALGPAAALAAGAFKGLGDGVFAAAREAAWEAFGVLDKAGLPAETAKLVVKILEERKGGKSGRWLRFTGKTGIFGVF